MVHHSCASYYVSAMKNPAHEGLAIAYSAVASVPHEGLDIAFRTGASVPAEDISDGYPQWHAVQSEVWSSRSSDETDNNTANGMSDLSLKQGPNCFAKLLFSRFPEFAGDVETVKVLLSEKMIDVAAIEPKVLCQVVRSVISSYSGSVIEMIFECYPRLENERLIGLLDTPRDSPWYG